MNVWTKLLLVCGLVFMGLITSPGQAAVPATVPFQGFLTDATGASLNAPVDLTFQLYTVPSGGIPIWSETRTGVAVTHGVFAVALGTVPAVSATTFDTPV